MKVLLILPQFLFGADGGWIGGYPNSAINLAYELRKHCSLTTLIALSKTRAEGESELRSHLEGVDLHFLNMNSQPTTKRYFAEFLVRSLRAVGKMRSSGDFDVVYGHSGFSGYGLCTWLSARRLRARAVQCIYCPYCSKEFQHKKVSHVFRRVSQAGVRRVDQLVAISQNVGDSLGPLLFPGAQVEVIPPALPVSLFEPPPSDTKSEKRGPRDGRPAVGFVGHHKSEKGIDLAIGAVAHLARAGIRVTLEAVISGGESGAEGRAVVQKMAVAAGIENQVVLHQPVKQMSKFLQGLDLLLVPFRGTRGPSDYPMVLLEGLALGVPVVATAVGAVPEVIRSGENGFLVTEPDSQSVANALTRALALSEEERKTVVARGFQAVQAFRAAEVCKRTSDLFSRLTSVET